MMPWTPPTSLPKSEILKIFSNFKQCEIGVNNNLLHACKTPDFFFFLAVPLGLRDLSSIKPMPLAVKGQSSVPWTARELP